MKLRPRFSRSNVLTAIVVVSISAFATYVMYKAFPVTTVPTFRTFVTVCDTNDDGCHITGLPYQNAKLSINERVTDLLSRMTDAEKIGQMALIEKNSIIDPNDVARYGLGALVSGAGAKPDNNTPEGWFRMIDTFKKNAQRTRLAIPLLYGVDASHGNGNVPGATIFPHFIGLGASKDPTLVQAVAMATSEEVASIGANWVFSPNLDVARDSRWGRTYETFGSDPKLVGALGRAYVEGAQSSDQYGQKMLATAKHYVGNGSTEWGSSSNKDFFLDQGNSVLSDVEMRQTHIAPFTPSIEAGVGSVMVGLNTWNGQKVSMSPYLLTDILRKDLGFRGFVVSDWYGVYEKEWSQYRALVQAVNAGVDMVMLPFDYKFFASSMHQALASSDISRARLDEAVGNILRVKFEMGLFDAVAIPASDLQSIGSEVHRELARKAVSESLVLLKGDKTIPITKHVSKIFVSGSAANNLGMQCGGWTVEWQGIDGNWIPGTTILKGIQDAASSDTKVEYDESGTFAGQEGVADIGIAVVGERPYSEGWGDNLNPRLSEQDLQVIDALKKRSKRLVVVIISGRPLNIKQYVKDWDAVIAAWLPGSEGGGVADVLFGAHPFTGALPLEWEL